MFVSNRLPVTEIDPVRKCHIWYSSKLFLPLQWSREESCFGGELVISQKWHSVCVSLSLLSWGGNNNITERVPLIRETMDNFNKFIFQMRRVVVHCFSLAVCCVSPWPCGWVEKRAPHDQGCFAPAKIIEMRKQSCLILFTWGEGDRGGEAKHCSFPYRVCYPCYVWRETPTRPPPTLLFFPCRCCFLVDVYSR